MCSFDDRILNDFTTANKENEKEKKIWWGADKSLARPTSRCRRTESIVSLKRRVCSCAELQVSSCYRGWKEACQVKRAISTTSRRELSSRVFFLQGKAPKEIHAILTETLGGTCKIVCDRQKLGGPVWTWWFYTYDVKERKEIEGRKMHNIKTVLIRLC